MDKNNGGSNDSSDSAKRRREANRGLNVEDYEFTKSTSRLKRRTLKKQDKNAENDFAEQEYYNECIDDDLDFDSIEGDAWDKMTLRNAAGRVLPQWTS